MRQFWQLTRSGERRAADPHHFQDTSPGTSTTSDSAARCFLPILFNITGIPCFPATLSPCRLIWLHQSGPAPMTDGEHRVLKFRPRTQDRLPANNRSRLASDLSRFENGQESPDDYRHRMVTNVAAIAFTAALTGIGIWLAMTLADLRNTQDCVLMGRRDCAHISAQRTDPVRQN